MPLKNILQARNGLYEGCEKVKLINISVRDKIAVNMSDVSYTCGNSDFVINFDFDAEWAAF